MGLGKFLEKRTVQRRPAVRTITDEDDVFLLEDKNIEEYQPGRESSDHNEEEAEVLPVAEVTEEPERNVPESDLEEEEEPERNVSESDPEEEEEPGYDSFSPSEQIKPEGEEEKNGEDMIGKAKKNRTRYFRKGTGRNRGTLILTGIILDGTISFTSVFPAFYYVMDELMSHMREKAKNYIGVTFKFGLTILHDDAKSVMFRDNTFFTEDGSLIMEELENMEFYGGSEDGKEHLDEALREQLIQQNKYEPEEFENVYRGVIMFSDSVPNEQGHDFSTDYLDLDQKIVNHGIRFARFYTYKGEYTPKMRMVDGEGRQTDNEKNSATGIDIRELVYGDVENVANEMKELASEILIKTSVAS